MEPGKPLGEKFQRIFQPRWSEELMENRTGDPDEALLTQSRNGDPAAFESLIRKHQRMIHSLTYRITGSLADADDLAQETFLRAYRQLGSYRAVSKFSTWLYRIAINLCLNWRQREKLRVEVHANWAEMQSGAGAWESPPAGSELNGRLHAALLKLPGKQRAAIMLTIYDGLNHAEAAEVLGCSETTVSWRVFVARRKVKGWLTHERF